jgi:hypothetical protein
MGGVNCTFLLGVAYKMFVLRKGQVRRSFTDHDRRIKKEKNSKYICVSFLYISKRCV